jgi:hypothetical protein
MHHRVIPSKIAFLPMIVLLVVGTPLIAVASGQDATALVIDGSKGMARFADQANADERQVLSALPDGQRVILIKVDAKAAIIFNEKLDQNTRTRLGQAILAVGSTGVYADLGAALVESVRGLSQVGGKKTIIILSDGVARAPRASVFRWKSSEQILGDPTIVPGDIDVRLRIYGTAKLTASRPNVHVYNVPPSWSQVVGASLVPPSIPGPLTHEPRTDRGFAVWLAAGVSVIVLLVGAVGLLWYLKRRGEQQRQILDAEVELTKPVAPTVEVPAIQPVLEYKLRFVVTLIETGRRETIDDRTPSMVIGDRWDADIELPECDAACVRLILNRDARSKLSLENCGETPILVGSVEVPSRGSQWLPECYLELSVGGRLVSVYPEMIPCETAMKGEMV